MKNIRLDFLDSLRGFAAIFVVLNHFSEAYNIGKGPRFNWISASPLHFFYNGPAAVSLFFVLSGYVIALSLEKSPKINLIAFYTKRIIRIWPVYAVAMAISYILYRNYTLQQTNPMSTEWIQSFWQHPMDIQHLLKQLFFLETSKDVLVPQSWTLRVIMQFSFLLPFLYIIYKQTNAIALLILNLVLYVVFSGSYFIIHFSLGIVMAVSQKQILEFFAIIKSRYKFLIILVTVGLFTYRWTIPTYYHYFFGTELPIFGSGGAMRFVSGVGSFFVLLYCLSSQRIQSWLSYKPFVAFGKLSYSIYLTHFMALLCVVPFLISSLNKAGIYNRYLILLLALAGLLISTTIMSYLLKRFVEDPFSKLSRMVGGHKRKKQVAEETKDILVTV